MIDDRTRTYSVAELGARIAGIIETAFPDDVWVQGTIMSLTRSRNGHVYFDLCEPSDVAGQPPMATLAVTLFKMNKDVINKLMKRAGITRMEDGMAVRIRGVVNYYAPSGKLQLRMTSIDPTHTLGSLAAHRDVVLRRLSEAGLLERQRSLAFAGVPLRIGLITSAGSAAYHDFVTELTNSAFGFTVTLIDAHVQGARAESSVCAALATFATRPLDVVALVRGGGSRVDLAAFDSERIARTIASLPIPVLTGIGHEVDRAVADDVAHLSFKTPTACAQFLVEATRSYVEQCEHHWAAIVRRAQHALDHETSRVRELSRHAARSTRHTLQRHDDRQRSYALAVSSRGRGAARRADRTIDKHVELLPLRAARVLDRAERRMATAATQIRAHDPQRVLARGFAMVRGRDGAVIKSIAGVDPGDEVVTALADGTITSTVTRTDETAHDDGH